MKQKANVYNRECPSQGILALIGSKWSMLVLCALRAGPARTHALKRRLDGVSAKMLTQTLRELERHGIVAAADLRRGAAARGIFAHAARTLAVRAGLEIENWVTANYHRLSGEARRFDADAA